MTDDGLHWLTMVATIVFVLAACVVLALSTATFAAIWIGRGGPRASDGAGEAVPGFVHAGRRPVAGP